MADTRFNTQFPIGPFICDFASRGAKLIIEVDGGQHAEQVVPPALDAGLDDVGGELVGLRPEPAHLLDAPGHDCGGQALPACVRCPDHDFSQAYETAQIIRQREQSKRIPIIFVSAVNKEDDHLACRAYALVGTS